MGTIVLPQAPKHGCLYGPQEAVGYKWLSQGHTAVVGPNRRPTDQALVAFWVEFATNSANAAPNPEMDLNHNVLHFGHLPFPEPKAPVQYSTCNELFWKKHETATENF